MLIQDKLNKLRNKRGFTLVELMIVVAIIGVLAALAIYGVRKYLSNAKTAEARMAIGRIAKDATVAYEKEKTDEGVVDLTETANISHSLCPSAALVPLLATDIQNKKYQSSPADWNQAGWSCLKFTMNDPQYFQYQYTAVQAAGFGPGLAAAEDDTFEVIGHGDLDGDGAVSTFTLPARIQAAAGELVLTLAPAITESNAEE